MFRAPHHVSHFCTRPTLLAACLAFCLQAHAESVQLQLPAQSLANSLSAVARQANIQLLFDEALLRNIKAPALSGRYSAQEAINQLLRGTDFSLTQVDRTFVVRPKEEGTTTSNSLQLSAMSVIGTGNEVDSSNVGKSTLTQAEINRYQANNIPSLLATLPGINLGGSLKPGGQTINIWGMGEAEDVQMTVDGATKSGFERYMQGTIFIEPELIKGLVVEKGPHDIRTGNGGFAGSVHMETKDAPDLLAEGKDTGAMLKYGYSSNDHQQVYSGAVYGRTDDGRADALVYYTKRDGDNMKLAGHMPDPKNAYPINPKRLPNTAQDLDAQLLKVNLHFNEEHRLGMSYSRSNNYLWVPFSAISYPAPPSQANIDKYGYDIATRRYLSNRSTIDTTWSAKYNYQPLENPLVNLEVKYSHSNTEQTDTRGAQAYFQPSTGGRKMETGYTDDMVQIENVSLFASGPLDHAVTTGMQVRKHQRDVDMWMPGKTYEVEKYNYGHYQPSFMPKGKVDTHSFYLQDAITLGDFTLTPSVRYDHVRNRGEENDAPFYNHVELGHDYSDKTYTGWSPRLSAFWKITPNTALFVDYSKTWRAPVIDEQYELQGLGSRTATSLNLKPEKITGWRAGNITNFDQIFTDSDHALIRTTLFQNTVDNEIFKATGVGCAAQTAAGSLSKDCGPGNIPNYRNIGSVTIKGFEVESFYESTYLFGSLSYAWMTGKHQGAYTNPWGPNVWARDIPAPKWVAVLGTKIPAWDARVGWKGEFVRKTDRLPSDKYSGNEISVLGDRYYDQHANDGYNVQGLFANWTPQQPYLKGTEVNFTVDNLFNKSYQPMLSGDNAYSQGRNAKISVTRFF
ncbi:TonB-dependent hemoglobin/transferrin/lactoferrin family receptor [Pseudomonas lundensis]|mgnify:FL=1|uniref:TonB-dependent receptor n=1 Tax=Pseudomonas lundensis TaxID=86185 RepID=UPI00147626F8|nr:TonB-dependent receptor [Pseudomonas lundensis]NNA18772.1 TonB-dependent hemoglobin/transferrin/lactoferrin family receptor [Pseudomonas lundensis]